MTPIWPDWIQNIWAKSPLEGQDKGENLATHTWNTLERLKEMIILRPNMSDLSGSSKFWHRLFWACWFHDYGKAADWFQAALGNIGQVYLRDEYKSVIHRHEVLSLAFLDWVHEGFSNDDRDWITVSILFHHKEPDEIIRRYPMPYQSDAWDDPLIGINTISVETLDGLWRWVKECAESWICELGLSHFGVANVSLVPKADAVDMLFSKDCIVKLREMINHAQKWLWSYSLLKGSKGAIGPLMMRGHVFSCDHISSASVGAMNKPSKKQAELLANWKMTTDALYPHQCASMSINGSAILMAPTGSGKTEAALLWASNQLWQGKTTPRIFYTLPYQASMNAMYDRLHRFSYPGQVGLEHGRNLIALYERFLEEYSDRQIALQAARSAKSLARLHHCPVKVLSPYQILKGFYRLKGYESLLTDLVNASFIFDEIHAYEPSRLAMILSCVRFLRTEFDSRFFIMSATLPTIAKDILSDVLGNCKIITASGKTFQSFIRHRLQIADGEVTDDKWLDRIVWEAKNSSNVLVCCNTVRKAQIVCGELRLRLNSSPVQVMLLHGRFNAKDRTSRERLVLELVGSKSSTRAPVILVSTQVVEVSLDVDFDVIYSELAPLEALIQRFGRVNRKRTRVYAPVWVFTQPADGQGIYEQSHVTAALKILLREADKLIDESQISCLLDQVYTGQLADEWLNKYQTSEKDFAGACIKTLRAFDSDETMESVFYKAFDSVEVLPACLEEEYKSYLESGQILEASGLRVPLSWRMAQRIGTRSISGVPPGKGMPLVVDVPYSTEEGLLLT